MSVRYRYRLYDKYRTVIYLATDDVPNLPGRLERFNGSFWELTRDSG